MDRMFKLKSGLRPVLVAITRGWKVGSNGVLMVNGKMLNDKLKVTMKFDRGYNSQKRFYCTGPGSIPKGMKETETSRDNEKNIVEYDENLVRSYYRDAPNSDVRNKSETVQNKSETVQNKSETVKPWWAPAASVQSLTYDELNSIDLREVSRSFDYHVPLSEYNKVYNRAVTAEVQLNAVKDELRKIKSPAAAKSKIEFYERENEVDIYNLTAGEQTVVSGIRDLKAKKIKVNEFKWIYILSTRNPKFNLPLNQDLLQRLKDETIDVDFFCRVVAVVRENTDSRWHELFDMNGEPVKVLFVESYDKCLDCLFERPIVP